MADKRSVEISTGIIFRTIMILLAVWFLYSIRNIVILLFIAILIVIAIEPAVDFFQRKKIPRALGVLIVYLLLFSAIGLAFSFLIQPVTSQIRNLGSEAGRYIQSFGDSFGSLKQFFQEGNIKLDYQQISENFNSQISNISGKVFAETVDVFSGIISSLVVFVIAFYMSLHEDGIKRFVVSLAPNKHKEYVASLTVRIKSKVGKWIQGQLVLMFLIFFFDFVGLYFLSIPYALTLAVFAGIMEVIPFIGPIVSAVPGVIIGFTISPLVGFLTIALYFLVQQFENHIIVPQIMRKALGLNPVAVILALLIGLKLGGVVGAIISIPLATAIGVFISDLIEKPETVI